MPAIDITRVGVVLNAGDESSPSRSPIQKEILVKCGTNQNPEKPRDVLQADLNAMDNLAPIQSDRVNQLEPLQ